MRTLRQIHLYLGCMFAPLILYFALSGVWQVFRLNDLPRDQEPGAVRVLLHELSKPHTNATLPGLSPKTDRSAAYMGCVALLGLGLASTTAIGILLAVRSARSRRWVWLSLGAGLGLPVVLLWLR